MTEIKKKHKIMRIYKFTYEEIDTEDKFNPATNTKLTCQQAVTEYELSMMYPHDKEYIRDVQDRLFKEIRTNLKNSIRL